MDERSARRAANEAVFRAGNERIQAVVGEALPRTPYMCECGDQSCFEPVELTDDEYQGVRAHPARFLVAPGHEDVTAGEVVIEAFGRFTVVEKRGDAAEIVTRNDPRAA